MKVGRLRVNHGLRLLLAMTGCLLVCVVTAANHRLRSEAATANPVDYTDAYNMPTGISPYFVVASDFNKDGYQDLATSNTVSHSLTVFINRGNGTFKPGVSYPTHGYTPYALASGDLNGDGYADLVCGNMFSINISIFYNKGDGTFADAMTMKSEPGPMFPVIADLNNDGKPDLAVCNIGHDDVAVYFNQGKGEFVHGGTYNCGGVVPYSVTSADFDGDGHADLATGNIYSSNVSILLNDRKGGFKPPTTYKTDSLTQIIYAADLNGDKHPDIVSGNGGSDTISVLINNGDGTFKPTVNYPVKLPQGVTAADLDGDGDLDIATADQSANTVSVLFNKGDGTFTAAVNFAAHGLYPISVCITDLNNDGHPDMVTSNSGSNDISVWLNGVHIPRIEQVTPAAANKVTLTAGKLPALINVKFNTNLNADALTAENVRVTGSQSGVHAARISYDPRNHAVEISPQSPTRFQPGEQVKLAFSTGVRSVEGLRMNTGYEASFDLQPEFGHGDLKAAGFAKSNRPPAATLAADLDQDGLVDMVSLEKGSDSVAIYFNGVKGLAAEPLRLATGGFDPIEAIAADLDQDGRLDLAVVNRLTGNLTVLFNEGQRRFSKAAVIAVPAMPVSLAAADFNGDGLIDLATANAVGQNVSLLFGAGDRKFRDVVNVAVDRVPSRLAVADVDGDGLPDLLTLNPNSDTITLLKNNGDGTFIKKDELHLLPSASRMLLARDINQDGAVDLLTVNYSSNDIAVFINNGHGTFRKPFYVAVDPHPTGAALADIDGNGWLDLIVAYQDGLTVMLNQGAAGGTGKSRFDKGFHMALATPVAPVAADINGDGAIDVISSDAQKHQFMLLFNQAAGSHQSARGQADQR